MPAMHASRHTAIMTLVTIMFLVSGIFSSAAAQPAAGDPPANNHGGEPAVIEANTGNGATIRSTDGGRSWVITAKEEPAGGRTRLARGIGATGLPNSITVSSITSAGSSVTIRYESRQTADIDIALCGVSGGALFTAREGMRGAGHYSITVDASAFPAGVYCYRITSGGSLAAAGKLLIDR